MIKSTPEGARDYLVPSRVHPGKFYALPQSPQQLKQLLMVSGVEKYFQIAKCFRDEDTRADRQPEFTQLDLEMSFVDEEDILGLMQELFVTLVETITPEKKIIRPVPRIAYQDAMNRFGTDRPDLRFGMELGDLSDIAAETEFGIFHTVTVEGGKVKGICAPGCSGYTRRQLEELNGLARNLGADGLVTMSLGNDGGSLSDLSMDAVKSVATRYMNLDQVKQMAERLSAKIGDLLIIVAGEAGRVNTVLGGLRTEMGGRLQLADPDSIAFDEDVGRWEPMHHPFTSPAEEDISLLDSAPEKVHGRHYDMVCNGYEIAGGSIRIHRSDIQRKVFRLLGYTDDEIVERFGHMLEAFGYGAPPHGGIAPGIDRIVMILAGEETIREVIAFPKNQNAADLTLNAPAQVSEEQLAELHLRLREE
jgi:aspartyl-tRNA synthetase